MLLLRIVAAAAIGAAVVLGPGAVRPARAQEPPEQGGEPDEEYSQLFEQGLELLKDGKFEEAIATFQKAIAIRKGPPETYYNIACAYSLKGDKERALDWLAEALAHGFKDEDHIAKDTDLDGIRGEPRFAELMAKAFPKARPGETLVTLKGERASLDRLKGKVVIVYFWRTWVEPCKEEIPQLVALEKELGPKGLAVVGISNESAPTQEQLADELKINFTLLRQTGPLEAPFENVKAFPTKYILDRDGKVVKKLVGARERDELAELVRPLLEGGGGKKDGGKKEPQVF